MSVRHYLHRLWPPAVILLAVIIMGGALTHLAFVGIPVSVLEVGGYVALAVLLIANPFKAIGALLFHMEAALMGFLVEFSEMWVRVWTRHKQRVRDLKAERYAAE